MSELIHVTKNDGISTVVIYNPPMNVLNSKVVAELSKIFQMLIEDKETVCIILTGFGDRVFSVGSDIRNFPDKNELRKYEAYNLIDNTPKPTIALLNGYTLGGGLELALTCDIRIAEEHAQIGLPEINLALLPGGGGTQRLPRVIGTAKAKEIMFTGEPLSAKESYEIGIVNKVVAKGEGIKEAEKLAKKIANKSLQALSRIKQLVDHSSELTLEDGLELEKKLFKELFETEDAKEGINAFIEKRKPVFKNK